MPIKVPVFIGFKRIYVAQKRQSGDLERKKKSLNETDENQFGCNLLQFEIINAM